MESLQLDHDGNCFEEASNKQLLPPSSPNESDIFGDPQVNTRVGDDYQVEIPSLMTEFERLQLLANPADSGVTDFSHSFLMGLPIPITWVHEVNNNEDETWEFVSNNDEAINSNVQVKARNRKKIHIKLKKRSTVISLEPSNVVGLDHEKESRTADVGNMVAGKTRLVGLHKSQRHYPVPGSKSEPWSDAEVNGFLLGLYIFGKNFILIKRFIENKGMREILSFYYGEFYRSNRYRRWSDSRKVRNRKCITGRKIFTGWRLQELLSRLLPHVPEESQSTLLEVLQYLSYISPLCFNHNEMHFKDA